MELLQLADLIDLQPAELRLPMIERVSSAAGLVAVEPLWAEPTSDLVNQFITLGGKAIIVTVRDAVLDQTWLGKYIDRETIKELVARGIDPCGEYGEYHSLVTYFPTYRHEISPSVVGIAHHGGCSLFDLTINAAP